MTINLKHLYLLCMHMGSGTLCLLYVAHGYKWTKEIADFVRWSQQYNLWCKMLYFGKQLEKELREEIDIQRQSGPQNLLDLLPDEFSKEQYHQMR